MVTKITGSMIASTTVAAANVAADVATQAELDAEASARTAAITAGVAGNVVQVVNTQTGAVATGTTVIPIDDTIPQNTEGDQYMTLAITPKAATNKLKIDVVVFVSSSVSNRMQVALFQDSTANAIAAAIDVITGVTDCVQISFTHYMDAGTTSATTFKVRAGGASAGTTTFNGYGAARKLGGVLASSITITEIKA